MSSIDMGNSLGNFMQRQISYDYNFNVITRNESLHIEKPLKLNKLNLNIWIPTVSSPD